MRSLSAHDERVRRDHPSDELCVVFDIDGTIVDTRHLVVHTLLAFDRARGTDRFRGLVADDIRHHEDDVEALVTSLEVPDDLRADLIDFYVDHLWTREALLQASRPFAGVLGVIRWFALRPGTRVALNTGRPARMRADTLASLNTIGAAYRVRFDPDHLLMAEEGVDVPTAKVAALRELRDRGLRVVAVVDNEPENLRAMAAADPEGEILFLHADTISESQRHPHDRVVSGSSYRLGALLTEADLSERVGFVWHGVNDPLNLQRFLSSDVRWAEVDVRRDPLGRLVLRHDAFDETPWHRDDPASFAHDAIGELAKAGRNVKVDLKEGGPTMEEAIDLVRSVGLADGRLWFNAELPAIGPTGFGRLRAEFPGSTSSCPIDAFEPLLLAGPDSSDVVSDLLRGWGITRLSIRWGRSARTLLDELGARGWQVNVYDVPDLEAFLEACLLLPASVTADFNFPEWGYRGRGSGAGGLVHRYAGE
jgi:phosphoglycolate phosphatase-like HAD superfamily hydrolase